jgi:hypothetical protein
LAPWSLVIKSNGDAICISTWKPRSHKQNLILFYMGRRFVGAAGRQVGSWYAVFVSVFPTLLAWVFVGLCKDSSERGGAGQDRTGVSPLLESSPVPTLASALKPGISVLGENVPIPGEAQVGSYVLNRLSLLDMSSYPQPNTCRDSRQP